MLAGQVQLAQCIRLVAKCAGEDLAIGSMVVGDAIRCLGHNLEFDLATGSCLNARCDPLVTRSLVRVASEAVDSPEMEGF